MLFLILACVVTSVPVSIAVPDKGLVDHFLQITYKDCVKECDSRYQCTFAKYIRTFAFCILYDAFKDTSEAGVTVYSKSRSAYELSLAESENYFVIIRKSCDDPNEFIGTEILGNMVHSGAKLKYKCIDDSGSEISACLDGSWSNIDLDCKCSVPIDKNTLPVENVAFWSFIKTNLTHISAFPTCEEGYFLRENESAVCDTFSGIWKNLGSVCCERFTKGSWMKVLSLPSADTISQDGILEAWIGPSSTDKYCQFRNNSFITEWTNESPLLVNMTVLKHNSVVAWIVFDTQNATNKNWFIANRLQNSSWTRVSREYSNDLAVKLTTTTVQFFIGKDEPGFNGWLGITRLELAGTDLSALRKPFIIYSESENSVQMQVSDIGNGPFGLADRIEIWALLP